MSNMLSVHTLVHSVRRLGYLFCVFAVLVSTSWSLTLTLADPVSSTMPDGSHIRFMDEASGTVYHATVHTHKAKNFLRRGSIRFEFEEPITITKNKRGVKAGSKK